MKLRIYILLFVVCISNVDALMIGNMTHNAENIVYFGVSDPLMLLTKQSVNNNYTVDYYKIKVSKPLSSISKEIVNHTIYSNSLKFNVSTYDLIRGISNYSMLYEDYIDSMNISVPIIFGNNQFDDMIYYENDVSFNGVVKYKNKVGKYPFNAVIVSIESHGDRYIVVYANAIEGDIAALRYLNEHKDEFVHFNNVHYLNDIDGLSVYDYMHLKQNHGHYLTDTDEFNGIVNKSLFGMIDEEIIDVKANDGVLLRVLEVKPLNSKKLIGYKHNISMPIVLARGLWSNLYSWHEFGKDLADDGRLVYLIELTGGPGQDCPTCINYNFDMLTHLYFPALVGTVQTLNNGSKVQYAGHSNGARTAVSSLQLFNDVGIENAGWYFDGSGWANVSMTAEPVDTLIAVGMPGAFDGEMSYLSNQIKENSKGIFSNLYLENLTHVGFWDIFDANFEFSLTNKETNKISLSLFFEYSDWISSTSDKQPTVSFDLNKLVVITGNWNNKKHDTIVCVKDNDILFNTSNAIITEQYYVDLRHTSQGDKEIVKTILINTINGEQLTKFKKDELNYRIK